MKHKKEASLRVNDKIVAPQLQLILHDGENIGVVSREDALQRAMDVDLDLVIIAEKGAEGMPVAKVMDHGKSLYEKKKKQAEAKKHQKVIQIKEIKIRPKIGAHDFETKLNRAVEFLNDGKRVKVTLWFRGRENALKEQHGTKLFERVDNAFQDHSLGSVIMNERDTKMGQTWSRIYYLKNSK